MTAIKFMQVYSDRAGAELVAAVAARFRRELKHAESSETVWNSELLRSPKLRFMAAREAAEAHLVLVATTEGVRLSTEVKQWLDLWRNRSTSSRATLVVFLKQENPAAPRGVERAFERFARAARMDFFCYSRVGLSPSRNRKRKHAVLI